MAKKASCTKKRAEVIVLGRNFLDVAKFKHFLDHSENLLDTITRNKLQRCYGACLDGLTKIEVNVVGILDNGLAVCKFRCRGLLEESVQSPAKCLAVIKPVPIKKVPHRNELDHLALAMA